MKLRNKKTGEIIELLAKPSFVKRIDDYLQSEVKTFNSLAELNEEWEDYEEPKEYYAIDLQGDIIRWARHSWDEQTTNKIKAIGNYFETEEEAELAVRKLKAWKRLKDKGFRIRRNNYHDGMMYLHIWNDTTDEPTPLDKNSETFKDLDLLFGGEE